MHRAPIPDPEQDKGGNPEQGDHDDGAAGFPAKHDSPLPDHNPS